MKTLDYKRNFLIKKINNRIMHASLLFSKAVLIRVCICSCMCLYVCNMCIFVCVGECWGRKHRFWHKSSHLLEKHLTIEPPLKPSHTLFLKLAFTSGIKYKWILYDKEKREYFLLSFILKIQFAHSFYLSFKVIPFLIHSVIWICILYSFVSLHSNKIRFVILENL